MSDSRLPPGLTPYRGRYPYVREVVKTGLGILNSSGWRQSALAEITRPLPNGRPAFFQFNVGERAFLMNVWVPRVWEVPR